MKIGVGLPNHVRDTLGPLIIEWARQAEQSGFTSLGTIDRLIYPSHESIVALSAAAAVTTNIGLMTNVLVAPIHPAALLAKQLTSLAAIAENRLVLGLGVGNRDDEYAATGADFTSRGRVLDETVALLLHAGRGETLTGDDQFAVTPASVQLPIRFGGRAEPTVRRIISVGEGWAGDGFRDYEQQAAFADRVRAAWTRADRLGDPRFTAVANFALGDDETLRTGREQTYGLYLHDVGNTDVPAAATAAMVTSTRDVSATIRRYADLGFDEVLFHPSVARLDQLDRLADAIQ